MLDNTKMSAKEASFLAGYKSDLPGRTWVKRFNEKGINGLRDKQRSGHPLIHTQDIRSCLISLALQKPSSLGYPAMDTAKTSDCFQGAVRSLYL